MRRERWIYPVLALITVAVFWPVGRFEFINFDDWLYVRDNPHVRQGLTAAGVGWAFQAIDLGNWHPVTWLSWMTDCQLFGLNAGAHHLVNLMFHVANTLLLFHLFRSLTREFWPSALVAALFAWHPLHVESVAWISERKDTLSTFFGLLALWAYWRRAQSKIQPSKAGISYYLLAIVFFALSLMSKPMLVTWPFVLLLLDFWPLGRVPGFGRQPAAIQLLLLEKLPFLVLSLASCAATLFADHQYTVTNGGDWHISPSLRIENVFISYVRYLGKTFWPRNLAVFYPFPPAWPAWQVSASAALLVLITIAMVWQTKRRPWLLFGWLWFLGTLVPVIGLVSLNGFSMADRYMYVPATGLFVMVAWSLKDLVQRWRHASPGVTAATVAAMAGCVTVTSLQLRYWQNTEILFRHTVAVTPPNAMAEYFLGKAQITNHQISEGLEHLETAVRIEPLFVAPHAIMAETLAGEGRIRESLDEYRAALRCDPDSPVFLNNLAWLLATADDPSLRNGAEAVRLAERACALKNDPGPFDMGTLAAAYAEAGRYDDAIRTAEQARALASASGEKDLAERTLKLLELYRAGRPYRENPGTK